MGEPYQHFDRFHSIVFSELILLHMGIQKTKRPKDEKGRAPLPYPDGCQTEADSIEPPGPRQHLFIHGSSRFGQSRLGRRHMNNKRSREFVVLYKFVRE